MAHSIVISNRQNAGPLKPDESDDFQGIVVKCTDSLALTPLRLARR
jgi:hypothetical protein